MTGTPFDLHASASFRAFATTFCSFACCGEPDSAKAPPSMITSFCRSWTISAQRDGSSFSSSFTLDSSLPHVRLVPGTDLGPDRVERRRRGDEERVPVLAAPRQVADVLG